MLEWTRRWLGAAACAAVIVASTGVTRGQGADFPIHVSAPGAMASVTLSTGDTLRCRVLQVTEDTVVLEHALLGRMFLSRDSVTAMTPPTQTDTPPLPPGPANPDDPDEPAANEDVADTSPTAPTAPTAAAPTGAIGSPLDLLTAPYEKFRTVSKAGWETIVDPDTKLNLKLGIEHRYDSDPGDAEASEIDYSVTMGWTF